MPNTVCPEGFGGGMLKQGLFFYVLKVNNKLIFLNKKVLFVFRTPFYFPLL
jgi:hypothetical protein